METVGKTHVGLVRGNNEDSLYHKDFGDKGSLLAVADGMGGAVGGEVASELAVRTLDGFDPADPAGAGHLADLICTAHKRIVDEVAKRPDLTGMATTMTLAHVQGLSMNWAFVGDSRMHLFRDHRLYVVTIDHTVPGSLIRNREISFDEARFHPMKHMLLRAVGSGDCQPETGTTPLHEGDVLLISSDGLHDMVSSQVIADTLDLDASLTERVDRLIEEALGAGGADNITIVAHAV